jgi:hypothetical protein
MNVGFASRTLQLRELVPYDGRGALTFSHVYHRKHLIVAIGDECYVTLSKGQIPPTKTVEGYPDTTHVPGGGHVLIVPIAHYPTIQSITPDVSQGITTEIKKLGLQSLVFCVPKRGLNRQPQQVQNCTSQLLREARSRDGFV